MYFKGISRNRIERIYLFAKTDYYLRYYGSKLGVLWSFLNPFFQILVYYFVFSYLIFRGRDSSFILYLFTGIITWQFFAESTNQAINLFNKQRFILQNMHLAKVDFFYSLTLSKFYAYMVSFLIYFIFAQIFFDPQYSWKLIYLIPVFIGLYLFTLGISFFLATLYIYLRDMIHMWTIILLAGFWLVPIIWDYHIILENYKFMAYNPITGFLIGIRQITLDNTAPDSNILGGNFLISLLIFMLGYVFMMKKSKKALEFL